MSMIAPTGWEKAGDRLARLFVFADFPAAMTFMTRVAFYCETADHHPEWKNIYNKVWVELTTHDAGGVTAKDVALAEYMNMVYGG